MQHRGQDAAGIVTYNKSFHIKKGLGLVRNIFREKDMLRLKGNIGIGHVRYPTAGVGNIEEAQPFIVFSPFGIALSHNGNVFNAKELKQELLEKNFRYINSGSDAEVILNIIASYLEDTKNKNGIFFDKLCKAIEEVYKKCRGAYAITALIAGKGLVAFRDPVGIRPLVWGKRNKSFRTEHLFASETVMFEMLDYKYHRNVKAGEVVFVDMQGKVFTKQLSCKEHRPCIFEYVYFARPDAFLNEVSVYRARLRMGQNLAKKIKKIYGEKLDIDVVIPAPSTANTAALSVSSELGIRYTEALIKNHFIGRTFIMPGQNIRKNSVRYKLSPIETEIRNKNILIVDDSIVRGNTSRQIVSMIRRYGAKKIYFASASPPLKFPCMSGIDMPNREGFIANKLDVKSVAKSIGVDELIYQDLEDLIEAVTRKGKLEFKRPCTGCFNRDYASCNITKEDLNKIEQTRREDAEISKKQGQSKMI